MRVFIDADASPVTKEVIALSEIYHLEVFVIKSYAHFSHDTVAEHVEVIYVDSEKDAADFAIASRVQRGDIVITQDYGLASICLAKQCHVIHHKGFLYTNQNIDRMLAIRHESAKARRAGYRTKGPKPYTEGEKEKFLRLLKSIIIANLNKE